jgi:hypothetical protein
VSRSARAKAHTRPCLLADVRDLRWSADSEIVPGLVACKKGPSWIISMGPLPGGVLDGTIKGVKLSIGGQDLSEPRTKGAVLGFSRIQNHPLSTATDGSGTPP